MTTTLIAGPHQTQYGGTLRAYAQTISYSHRIRALARDAAHKETDRLVSRGAGVGSERSVEWRTRGPACMLPLPHPRKDS